MPRFFSSVSTPSQNLAPSLPLVPLRPGRLRRFTGPLLVVSPRQLSDDNLCTIDWLRSHPGGTVWDDREPGLSTCTSSDFQYRRAAGLREGSILVALAAVRLVCGVLGTNPYDIWYRWPPTAKAG
jgi:hypothetical protein